MMNLSRGSLLLLLTLIVIVAPACVIDTNDSGDTQPTAIVVTSTPTSSSPEEGPTPTDAATSAPQATGAASATPADGEPSPTPSGDQTTPTEDSSGDSNSAARAEIEAIEADVVDLRGLDLVQDLNEEIIDRQELASRVNEIVAEEYTPEDARVDALSYWLLRLIPDRSLDLYQLQIDLLSEQIAGYYDPETKALVVVTDDGSLSAIDKVTMAHEIVHALQDQHFDLIAIDDFAVDADHDAAITALVEGDATLAMTDYMLGYLDPVDLMEILGETFSGTDTTVLDNAPRYISEGLTFSYDAGQTFATALVDEGGYDAVNAALTDPPSSTEQILHPEKYIAANRDEPMIVDNPDVSGDLGSGWELLRGDVAGEWDLKIMLEDNGVSSSVAATAAAGWGGSWYDIYESDSGSLALLTTRWDSDNDATEFADALLDSFPSGAENGGLWEDSGRYFSVIAGADTVVMISGTDEAAVARVQAVIEQTV